MSKQKMELDNDVSVQPATKRLKTIIGDSQDLVGAAALGVALASGLGISVPVTALVAGTIAAIVKGNANKLTETSCDDIEK